MIAGDARSRLRLFGEGSRNGSKARPERKMSTKKSKTTKQPPAKGDPPSSGAQRVLFSKNALKELVKHAGYPRVSAQVYPAARAITTAIVRKATLLARENAKKDGRKTIYLADIEGDDDKGVAPISDAFALQHPIAGTFELAEKDRSDLAAHIATYPATDAEEPTKEVGSILAQAHVNEVSGAVLKEDPDGGQIAKEARPVLQKVAEQAVVDFFKLLVPITAGEKKATVSLGDLAIGMRLLGLL